MSQRPRRSAAAKAKEVISVHARWADTSEKSDGGDMSSRRSGRVSGAAAVRDDRSSPEDTHLSVTVKVPSGKLRQAARASRRSDPFEGGEIVHGKRNRGGKKSYVIDSSPDDDDDDDDDEDDEDDDEDDEDKEDVRLNQDDEDDDDEDAEGEDDMDIDADGDDIDAEGEEDVDGDIDMVHHSSRSTAKDTRSTKAKLPTKVVVSKNNRANDHEDDDDELSDPADSDIGDDTIGYGDETMADEDAEGEEIEVAGDEDVDDEDDEDPTHPAADVDSDLDSDDGEGSRGETPDLAKMTKRQRARFEDIPQEFMKLPDEIQVKKVFTAEELSMRRQEMARRRRNLSEKRNEEVKMETINKLLKKQAPKINRKSAAAAAAAAAAGGGIPTDAVDSTSHKANAVFIRWVSSKNGSRVAVPEDVIEGPGGNVFRGEAMSTPEKLVDKVT